MKLTGAQWLILVSTLLTVAIGVATNIATDQMPAWAQPYLWLAWPLLVLLTILFLFVTWRQVPAELGPPSRELVRTYLHEVAAEPVHTLADEVLGEEAFIPRQVAVQETRGLFPRFATTYRPDAPEEEAQPEPLEAVLAQERHLVLLGEPGMGKTTSLQHLAQVAAQQALAGSGDIPIYVELKNYAGEAELETLLVRRVDDVLKGHKFTLGYDEAKRTQVMRAWLAARDARFLLLLDGLNEVAPDHRVSALNALKGLLSYPHCLLVSCREQDYDESLREHASAFVLQGLQEDEIRGYLRARLSDRGKTLFDDQIRWDEKMRTLVANPLMLWLVGEVALADPEVRLPANRGQLLRVFAEAMPGLRRREGVPMPDVPQDVVEAALRALAFATQEHGPLPPDLGQVRGWDLPTATYRLEDVLAAGKAWRFLKSDGQHSEPIEFLHPLFQEYFAADALRDRLEQARDYAAVLGDCLFRAGWDEVLVMLAGIYDRPGELVHWLGQEAAARQQGHAALLVYRCWETSDAVEDTKARAAVVDILIGALGDPDAEVRLEAARALGWIRDPRAVELLIGTLDNSDTGVRKFAVLALGWIRDPRAVEPLIRVLGDPEALVRKFAVWALGWIRDPRAVEPLIGALDDPDTEMRWGVAEALQRIGKPAVEPLIGALGNPDAEVSAIVLYALVRIGAPVVEPLICALDDPDAKVRMDAKLALLSISAPAVEPLIGALGNPNAEVSAIALYALVSIGAPAVEPLVRALDDPKGVMRWRVAQALGEIGDPQALPGLERVTREDQDERVVEAAQEAAERIRQRMGNE